LRVGTLWGRC